LQVWCRGAAGYVCSGRCDAKYIFMYEYRR
jgi:hypothetical protein